MLPKTMLLEKLVESGVIAVVRRIPTEKIDRVAESLVRGGVTALEITVDSEDAFSSIARLSRQLRGVAIVGAGTVIDAEAAAMAIQSGADFLFSPSLHHEVIRVAARHGKICVPGVLTPTEMITAIEWGADLVKLFPAASFGPAYLQAVKAPFPHIPIIPTGGIDEQNASSFIQAGAAALGIGGTLLDRKLIEAGDFGALEKTAKTYVELVREARRAGNESGCER
ncbi:bifunctional 4-hydroxy-2-oxoglutarate aldolase/2-dehydro-3-deoxy-phosphogluconate aldolase [Brevibacillus choshinensis]|uniref:Bifunctional 4-hydroxy-2-oxoglutarate aldolase/2-dehydro-3-deoxy-phosphogluconate aldolase n=1 Tax=Brevibacillus choshinensis TaxID=54911 RepID=A0ABX7FKF8_BRECH|nr:bifunctional 4-hydroxy-2-oxoglutarate aldolase/2-dehydro-3-deoxy-phosphogluconate aldolase [Brevibacillus choshinensis]QRG66708.1 bifunctional 4-hydroxy-2-oxoglutarate aldolase/2-dehydro-3-deoxy-phosphogluconate aldolase [Brevibacillus choshinensis]